MYTIFSALWPSAHPTSRKDTFFCASHSHSLGLSPLNTSGSLILGLLEFSPAGTMVGTGGGAGPELGDAGLTGPLCVFMVFLLV